MSNFETFAMITEGNISTAPNKFVASTVDSLATILAAGYLNDLKAKLKQNDQISIGYSDLSHFPLDTGTSTIYGDFRVQYDPTLQNWNLIAVSNTQASIASSGVYSTKYDNAGGSATTVITNPNINPNMLVFANWLSSANAVGIETVIAGNGTLTVVSTGDPGVSVLSIIAVLPSLPLQNLGVYANSYAYAGGGTSIVITDANITTSMVVKANFASQTNAAYIEKVTVAAGSITILVNTNPGASVFQYLAVSPSTPLTNLGMYGANYTNAGGSATTTITDSTITANSVVVGNWEASANAVYVEKVTPSANTLTILSSGDPGASTFAYVATPSNEGSSTGQYLLAANNLSDVASASTSLANLGALPLAGGTMTGKLTFTEGTGNGATPTISKQAGVVTTASLTTTATTTATATTITNTFVTSTSTVLVSLMGGTNTIPGVQLSAVATTNTITVSVTNNNVAGSALNGTLIIGFVVLN